MQTLVLEELVRLVSPKLAFEQTFAGNAIFFVLARQRFHQGQIPNMVGLDFGDELFLLLNYFKTLLDLVLTLLVMDLVIMFGLIVELFV